MSFRTVNGSTHSENGWKLCNRDECVTVAGPFMTTAPLRKGAAEITLGDFARRYHAEVAPIISPVWGWSATNDVLGQWGKNNGSNHLGGTALDINAPQWPWGAKTMGSAIIGRTEELLKDYEVDGKRGVFWGRVWSKPDEMHFQMGFPEGDPRNDVLVARILKRPTTPTPSVPSTPDNDGDLMRGSTGQQVRQLQAGLNRVFSGYSKLDVDGDYGPATEAVVREFQTREKATTPSITVDGIVGPVTRRALSKYGIILTPADVKPAPVPSAPLTDRQVLDLIRADAAEIRAQLGVGHESWPTKGTTLRDKLWAIANKVGA